MRFSGKVAVVTGGASGIGKATVRRLATEGAAVVIGDLNPTSGEALARDITSDGREASFVHVDVGDDASMANLVDVAVERYGRLDIMFNNAGIGQHLVKDEAGWWRLVRVNLTGVFLGCKHAVRVMLPRGQGSIINTASHAGTLGSRGNIYGATKAGVISLTTNVASEVVGQGLRVNAMSPGNVETPFADPRRDEMMRQHWAGQATAFAEDPVVKGEERPGIELSRQRLDAMHPSGHRAMPDDLARSVAFLASDESAFVMGHNLMTTGFIIPPTMARRIVESRSQGVRRPSLDSLVGTSVVLATENERVASAFGAAFESRGARVVTLDPKRYMDAASVRAALEAFAENAPIAALVFAMRPDRGGKLADTTVDAWTDEMRANLWAPTLVVEAAIEQVMPGGAILIASDLAGFWGGPGSPAYSTMAGALTFHTEYWASIGLSRGVRVNCLIVEDLSHTEVAPTPGGPASATELAAMGAFLTTDLPGLSGLQLNLGVVHPYPQP
jgi:NAD(P)-dependent dehydrogenase (short-subunit alcohol dehydrogenase family)